MKNRLISALMIIAIIFGIIFAATSCGSAGSESEPVETASESAEDLFEKKMGLVCNLPEKSNSVKEIKIGFWQDDTYKGLISDIEKKTGIAFKKLSKDEMASFKDLKQNKGYYIKDDKGKIKIAASNSEMLYVAITKVLYGKEKKDYSESYKFPARDEYIKNPDLFVTSWSNIWKAPEWLLDYDKKKESFFSGNRPMIWAHRGGGDYYPDNSVEAIISSIKMGADILELDFWYTKDRVLVLSHDDTLYTTTDWSEKNGKNGLPTSDKIADWTYEQLQQLNLKSGDIFARANISEYKIPTLEEVLYVCNNRAFFVMDKINTYEEWQNIRPVIVKTRCAEPFAFAYKFDIAELTKEQISLKNELGSCGPYFYVRKHTGDLETEVVGTKERLHVFDRFSSTPFAAIMTNYVKDLVEYIDWKYGATLNPKAN